MVKFYYVNTECYAYGNKMDMRQVFVCDQHPFLECHRLNKIDNYETVLISWQEITAEEYDLFKQLEEDI